MTKKKLFIVIAFFMFFSCVDENKQLRGYEENSPDENSYLVIEKGSCKEYFLDDKSWPYELGEKGEITPGDHCLSCGENGKPVFAGTCFKVRKGKIFHFDYWGP